MFFFKIFIGGRLLFIKWLLLVGLFLGVDEKFFLFIFKVGFFWILECFFCFIGIGEGVGDDCGFGLGVICICIIYVK